MVVVADMPLQDAAVNENREVIISRASAVDIILIFNMCKFVTP
jgi:hypothetical protein